MSATVNNVASGLIVWFLMVVALPLLPEPTVPECAETACEVAPPVYAHTGPVTVVRSADGSIAAYVRQLRRL